MTDNKDETTQAQHLTSILAPYMCAIYNAASDTLYTCVVNAFDADSAETTAALFSAGADNSFDPDTAKNASRFLEQAFPEMRVGYERGQQAAISRAESLQAAEDAMGAVGDGMNTHLDVGVLGDAKFINEVWPSDDEREVQLACKTAEKMAAIRQKPSLFERVRTYVDGLQTKGAGFGIEAQTAREEYDALVVLKSFKYFQRVCAQPDDYLVEMREYVRSGLSMVMSNASDEAFEERMSEHMITALARDRNSAAHSLITASRGIDFPDMTSDNTGVIALNRIHAQYMDDAKELLKLEQEFRLQSRELEQFICALKDAWTNQITTPKIVADGDALCAELNACVLARREALAPLNAMFSQLFDYEALTLTEVVKDPIFCDAARVYMADARALTERVIEAYRMHASAVRITPWVRVDKSAADYALCVRAVNIPEVYSKLHISQDFEYVFKELPLHDVTVNPKYRSEMAAAASFTLCGLLSDSGSEARKLRRKGFLGKGDKVVLRVRVRPHPGYAMDYGMAALNRANSYGATQDTDGFMPGKAIDLTPAGIGAAVKSTLINSNVGKRPGSGPAKTTSSPLQTKGNEVEEVQYDSSKDPTLVSMFDYGSASIQAWPHMHFIRRHGAGGVRLTELHGDVVNIGTSQPRNASNGEITIGQPPETDEEYTRNTVTWTLDVAQKISSMTDNAIGAAVGAAIGTVGGAGAAVGGKKLAGAVATHAAGAAVGGKKLAGAGAAAGGKKLAGGNNNNTP